MTSAICGLPSPIFSAMYPHLPNDKQTLLLYSDAYGWVLPDQTELADLLADVVPSTGRYMFIDSGNTTYVYKRNAEGVYDRMRWTGTMPTDANFREGATFERVRSNA